MEGISQASMPRAIKPMLATLTDEAFDSDEWLYEIKWDGYRAVAYVQDGEAELTSRNNQSFTEKYSPITEALQSLPFNAVFDGEVVTLNEKGLSDFQLLQNWQSEPVHLQYNIFDIIWLQGYDLTQLPLVKRKEILQQILPKENELLHYSDHISGNGIEFFKAALDKGLEGIMAKRKGSTYQINSRNQDWLKIKVNQRQEVVIAGYTAPRNSRKYFGALMLGVYDGDQLKYVGHTGSGFNQQSLASTWDLLQPLVIDDCPFETCPKGNNTVTWVKPKLVCEIKFTEWTKEGIARHPIFMGLRSDKKPSDVRLEKATTIKSMEKKAAVKAAKKSTPAKSTKTAVAKKAASKTPAKKTAKPFAPKGSIDTSSKDDQFLMVNNHEIKLTSLNKLYWKKEKLTKGDSINYYLQIAPYIIPYLKDRPMSLNRHPNGIDAPNFFQKDMKGGAPEWATTHVDFSESTNSNVEYLVCSNEASLIYMANLGCIEMNPWHSITKNWQNPDWCLIDLDPDKPNTFEQVIDVALVVKDILDSIGAECCVKTSGSSGIHIYIPLGAKYDYEQSKQLAQLVVTMAHNELPDLTSLERSPAKRKGKIYLDFLQNRETQTAAAPYSLRPKREAPVSTPLHWDEVKYGLTPTTYNMKNIFDRLKTEGDLFEGVLGKGINLQKVLRTLESLSK